MTQMIRTKYGVAILALLLIMLMAACTPTGDLPGEPGLNDNGPGEIDDNSNGDDDVNANDDNSNSNDDDANMNLEETYAEASDKGLRTVFLSCALLALLGFFWTWYFITTDQAHESLTKYAESNLSNDLSRNHFDDGVWDTNGVEVELTELDEENDQQSNSSTTLSFPEKAGANTYL